MTQDEALAVLESGSSALLTGAAGAGKTYLLNKFIDRSRQRGKSVAVTATTGLAATHLHGTTIHAWAGIGVHDRLDSQMTAKLGKTRQELLRRADILIIDEISMLHDFRLDMVDLMLRHVRETDAPFGAMQVVLCGDFFQLPPVNRRDGRQGGFVTSSQIWQQNVFKICYLKTQFRQSDDQNFTDILNGIRAGVLTRNQLKALQSRAQATDDPFAARTHLLTVNVDVDEVNHRRLNEIDGETREYYMTTSGSKNYVEQLQRSCLAPAVLKLKVGAQVMCIKNSAERKYANGSLGKVVAFEEDTDYPVIKLVNGRTVTMRPESWELMDGDKRRAAAMQLPLKLAWAITVHKSQGMTLDAARIDLGRAFVEGMGYVALSRVRSLQKLTLDNMNGMALRVSPLARQIDAELQQKSSDALRELSAQIAAWKQAEERGENVQAVAPASPDPELLTALKRWRSDTARAAGVPPYIIAHDKTLAAVASARPQDVAQLGSVPGFGPKKCDQHGDDIVRIVAETSADSATIASEIP